MFDMRLESTITLTAVGLTIILFFGLWYSNYRCIKDLKSDLNAQLKEQLNLSHQYQGPFNIETKKLDSVRVEIEASEIKKVNEQIKYLTDVVQNQHLYAQEVIENDLNRLNLYMAVGIGFLSLIGVFIPIVTNLVSTSDLQTKVSAMETKLNPLEKQLEDAQTNSKTAHDNASKAIKAADEANGKAKEVENLKETVDAIALIMPTVTAMTIQYAVARFINMSPYALDSIVRKQERGHLAELIIAIKAGFEECRAKRIPITHYDIRSAANDFEISLRNGKHVTSSLNGRLSYAHFEELQRRLITLRDSKNPVDSDMHYTSVIDSLQNVIDDVNLVGGHA
jgi:negative regulator of replication initiation